MHEKTLLLPVIADKDKVVVNATTLPLPGANAKSLVDASSQPHALLGMACVAASAVCFSVMSTFVKLDTYSMTSMEAVFWRSCIAGALNYVRSLLL